MAYVRVALLVALAVAVMAEPIRYRRNTEIVAAGAAAAVEGTGAAENAHATGLAVTGSGSSGWGSGWGEGSGWGSIPASAIIVNTGESFVGNAASIVEVTSNDGAGNLNGLQTVNTDQLAIGDDQLDVEASGIDIALGSSGSSDASGWGSSAAGGELVIDSNQSGGWGMAKP